MGEGDEKVEKYKSIKVEKSKSQKSNGREIRGLKEIDLKNSLF